MMRIPSTKTWLAVALTMGIGRVRGASQPALNFSNDDFDRFGNYDGSPILVLETLDQVLNEGIVPPEQLLRKTFTWRTADQNLWVEQVSLFVLNETGSPELIGKGKIDEDKKNHGGNGANESMGGGVPAGPEATTTTTPTGTRKIIVPQPSQSSEFERRAIPNFVQQTIALYVSSSPTEGSVTIPDVRLLAPYSGSPLYFGAIWPENKGETYSRAFAVVNTSQEAAVITETSNRFRNLSSVFEEDNPDANNAAPTLGLPPGSTTTATSNPIISPQENEGGLSTGAIIGIAVACGVLGLLLVLAGIWFLIRRRNKQAGNTHLGSPGRPYGAERSRTEDLIAEKEASAGGADPSPHSPYSDDGVVLVPSGGHASTYHNGGPSVGLGTPVAAPMLPQQIPRLPQPHDHHHHQQAGPYTTYSDRGSVGGVGGGGESPSTHAASIVHSTNEEVRAGMGSPTAGRATPHSSLAPQYQHLVEEGMTEDEIRRLEDEERQLDAEIERAGRR